MANGTIPRPLSFFDTIVSGASTNGTLTVNFTDNTQILLLTFYNSTNKLSAHLVFGRPSGTPYVLTIAAGSAITVDDSATGKLTITSSSGNVNVYAIPMSPRALNGFYFS